MSLPAGQMGKGDIFVAMIIASSVVLITAIISISMIAYHKLDTDVQLKSLENDFEVKKMQHEKGESK